MTNSSLLHWHNAGARALLAFAIGCLAAPALAAGPADGNAARASTPGSATAAAPAQRMKAYRGVWVEGSDFPPRYGGDYEACAKLCIAEARCVMLEYYRPEKKCNRYASKRKMIKGGSSIVAVKE